MTAQLIANAFNCAVVLFFVFRSWCADRNVCIASFFLEAAAEVIMAAVYCAGATFTLHIVMPVCRLDFITTDIAANSVFDNH
jgi:hypothetical protein